MRHTRVKYLNRAIVASGLLPTKRLKRRARKLWQRRHGLGGASIAITKWTAAHP